MYTLNGSIPTPLPEGVTHEQYTAAGWQLVTQRRPSDVDGKEVVWLNWEWVKRDIKPDDRDGYRWKWNHDRYEWVEYALPAAVLADTPQTVDVAALTSTQPVALSSEQVSML